MRYKRFGDLLRVVVIGGLLCRCSSPPFSAAIDAGGDVADGANPIVIIPVVGMDATAAADDSTAPDGANQANASDSAPFDATAKEGAPDLTPFDARANDGATDSSLDASADSGSHPAPLDAGTESDAPAKCPAATPDSCGVTCTNTQTDPKNCGSCGHDCTALKNVNGPATCNTGTCSVPESSCAAGWMHCSANANDGCETDVSKPASCGSCTTVCPPTAPQCSGSGSRYACVTGCAPPTSTLCGSTCVDTTSNASYCGNCTTTCTGGMTCQSSQCKCPSGKINCSGVCEDPGPQNGCGSGGVCGGPCPVPTTGGGMASCSGMTCAISCSAPTSQHCGSGCFNTTSDPNNCGSCGHSCLGGRCSAGLCQPFLLTALGNAGLDLAIDSNDASIYVNNGNQGTLAINPNTGASLGSYSTNAGCKLVAPAQDPSQLYFSCIMQGGWAILAYGKSNFAGGVSLYSAATGTPAPYRIAATGTALWWTDLSGGLLQGNISGGQMGTIRETNAVGNVLAADDHGLVWEDTSGALWTTSPTTFGTPTQLRAPAGGTSAILVDSTYAYFEDTSGNIYRSARDGSILTKLGAVIAGHNSYEFAIDNSAFYWADNDANAIYSVPLTGSGTVTTVATGQTGAFGIVVDNQAIYWTANGLMKLAK